MNQADQIARIIEAEDNRKRASMHLAVKMEARRMETAGVVVLLPPKDRWDSHTLCLHSPATVYRMVKWGWNAASGAYDNQERRIEELTIKEVRQRVRRLPDTTRHMWTIFAISTSGETRGTVQGRITADRFIESVPLA